MEILFLYIKKYRLFKEQAFNFTSNHRFQYDPIAHKLSYTFSNVLPQSFFSHSHSDSNKTQVSAIVGNNGSGKTSIAQIIIQLLQKDKPIFEHILIFKIENTFYMSCLLMPQRPDEGLIQKISEIDQRQNNYNLRKEREKPYSPFPGITRIEQGSSYRDVPRAWDNLNKLISLPEKYNNGYARFIDQYEAAISEATFDALRQNLSIGENIVFFDNIKIDQIKIVYHSNFYNTTDNWGYKSAEGIVSGNVKFVNISTTGLLYDACQKHLNLSPDQQITSRYLQTEMFRKYELLEQSRFLTLAKKFKGDIPLPIGVRIEANSNDWNRFLRAYDKKKASMPKYLEQYLVRISKWEGDIFLTALNFWKEFFISIFGNWAYYNLINSSVNVIWKNTEKLKLFFDELCSGVETYLSYNANPSSAPRGIVCFLGSVFEKYLAEDSLFDACDEKGIPFNRGFTPKLSDIYQLIVVLDKYSTDKKCPYIKLDSEFIGDFETIWKLHDRIATITSFLSAEYVPAPSSGEISLLSIYARLYSELTKNSCSEKHLLIFFDETEVTMHPELQRVIIDDLIDFFEYFIKNNKIHMFFLTHSPILLSDIPVNNVCFLRKHVGKQSRIVNPPQNNTFGCNIFDLYKDSFFLNNGTIGKLATDKINDIIQRVNSIKREDAVAESDLMVIKQIGDSAIRRYIEKTIAVNCRDVKILNELIDMCQEQIKILRQKLDNCDD